MARRSEKTNYTKSAAKLIAQARRHQERAADFTAKAKQERQLANTLLKAADIAAGDLVMKAWTLAAEQEFGPVVYEPTAVDPLTTLCLTCNYDYTGDTCPHCAADKAAHDAVRCHVHGEALHLDCEQCRHEMSHLFGNLPEFNGHPRWKLAPK